ncbi:hypothetical protein H5410_046822 [Solanum commersonii]|uniref:Uncharacterized protein n=1 Tax=Solanum commersonii TaxID=4109 RepID=A0A9J5XGK7_SOLCO|nr:hypothetical protein H5410_046822 [Solanum commersonii]
MDSPKKTKPSTKGASTGSGLVHLPWSVTWTMHLAFKAKAFVHEGQHVQWTCPHVVVPSVEVQAATRMQGQPSGLSALEQKAISKTIGDLPTGFGNLQAFISSFFSAALFLLAK